MDLIPLGPGFAAEVRGAGLADVAVNDTAYRFVRAAFEAHSVLLFRKQPVSNELHDLFRDPTVLLLADVQHGNAGRLQVRIAREDFFNVLLALG